MNKNLKATARRQCSTISILMDQVTNRKIIPSKIIPMRSCLQTKNQILVTSWVWLKPNKVLMITSLSQNSKSSCRLPKRSRETTLMMILTLIGNPLLPLIAETLDIIAIISPLAWASKAMVHLSKAKPGIEDLKLRRNHGAPRILASQNVSKNWWMTKANLHTMCTNYRITPATTPVTPSSRTQHPVIKIDICWKTSSGTKT